MFELLLRIENVCGELPPATLLLIGAIAAVMGLFLWLGGTSYSSTVIGLAGAALGGPAGLLLSEQFTLQPLWSVLIGATLFAIIAVWLQKIVIILLTVIIFATAGGTGYMGYLLNKSSDWHNTLQSNQIAETDGTTGNVETDAIETDISPPTSPQETYPDGIFERDHDITTAPESIKDRIMAIFSDAWASASGHQINIILFALIGGIAGLLLAWLIKRMVMALCYSIVGSTMTIGAIQLLLLAKGVAIIAALESRPGILPIIFTAMVIFGWVVQLLLVRSANSRQVTDDSSHGKKGKK